MVGSDDQGRGGQQETKNDADAARSRARFAATPRPGRFRARAGQELIGIAVLVVLSLVCAGLITAVVLKTQRDTANAAQEAAAYTPPAVPSGDAANSRPVIAVITDESASRAASGVSSAQRWPQVLAKALDARVVTSAVVGAGYSAEGTGGATFADAVARVPAGAETVVFVGGAADTSVSSLEAAQAATQAFSAASERAPDATIIAVGPLFRPASVSAADMGTIRRTLNGAANIAGVRWVDPIGSDWLSNVNTTTDLTPATERSIASRMRTAIEGNLD